MNVHVPSYPRWYRHPATVLLRRMRNKDPETGLIPRLLDRCFERVLELLVNGYTTLNRAYPL